VPGHVPLRDGEHPRLIFRKAELARLRKLAAAAPEGKAIMERFWSVIDRAGPQQADKFAMWPAVGWGFAYQMTGERKYAVKAQQLVGRYLRPTGGQDIHHGPRLMGLALTFDLCCEAWDEGFRRQCVDEIQQRTLECATGTFYGHTMGGFNPNWWSNHNGIRAGVAGLGALAVLGEKNTKGQVLASAAEIADQMAWEARGYLRDGLGGGAWCMEGMFYKGMTMRRGLMHFLHAYRKVTGRRIDAGSLGDFLIAGYFVEAAPGRLFPRVEKWDGCGRGMMIDGEPLADLVWSLGLTAVPRDMMPGVKHLLDRSVGLKGDRTFGIGLGLYAPYVLATYPFDRDEKHPGDCFRWLSPDPRNGHWVFRPVWKDRNDILMTLNLQSRVRGGCHYERTGIMSGWRLVGFGQTWIDGQYHPTVQGKGEAVAEKNGPQTLSWKADGRTAVLTLDTTPAYMPPVREVPKERSPWHALARKQGGLRAHWLPHWDRALVDYGIRARRHIAVDCSGAAVAPILIAVVEEIGLKRSLDADAEPADFTWKLPLSLRRAKVTTEGSRFTVTKGDATLTGIVLGADSLGAKDLSTAVRGGKVMAVLTLQRGRAPGITVEGEGVGAKVTVGGRSVSFADGSLRLE
jgi:hypothetical protein